MNILKHRMGDTRDAQEAKHHAVDDLMGGGIYRPIEGGGYRTGVVAKNLKAFCQG